VGGELRARKKARTRHDLVDAAMRLFAEQGYEATTIDQIAEAADYSRRTFFLHFRSKEDVVFADVEDSFLKLKARLELAPAGADPWRVAAQVMQDITQEAFDDPAVRADCRLLWYTEPALAGRYHATLVGWESVVAGFLAERWGVDLASGSIDAVEVQFLASTLVAAMRIGGQYEALHEVNFPLAFGHAVRIVEEGVTRHRRPSDPGGDV
jgi:AcrR family transcriptional regulator